MRNRYTMALTYGLVMAAVMLGYDLAVHGEIKLDRLNLFADAIFISINAVIGFLLGLQAERSK